MDFEPPVDPDFLRSGWVSWLPDRALLLHAAIRSTHLRGIRGDLDSLMLDYKFRTIIEACCGGSLDAGSSDPCNASTPEELLAWERTTSWLSDRVRRLATMVGLNIPDTNRDTIELMRRSGLVVREKEPGIETWRTVSPLPLPEDIVPLGAREKAVEDEQRWDAQVWRTAFAMLRHFSAMAVPEYHVSLYELSVDVRCDVEDVRLGMMCLQKRGDISLNADVGRLLAHELLYLRMKR